MKTSRLNKLYGVSTDIKNTCTCEEFNLKTASDTKEFDFFKITVKPGVVDTRVQQCVKS